MAIGGATTQKLLEQYKAGLFQRPADPPSPGGQGRKTGETASLSTAATAAKVEEAYARWDAAIAAGVQDPRTSVEVKAVLKQAMLTTQQQAEQAGKQGQPFDRDAALAYNLAQGSALKLDNTPQNSPCYKAFGDIFDTSVDYINARHDAL
ncbi:MAG: hypothetical protein AB1758_29730 [Candidatus Eremiobacterota bacterium]